MRNLNYYGDAYVYDHDLDEEIFKDDGWNHVVRQGTQPYAISSHVDTYDDYNIIQLIFTEVVHHDNRSDYQALQMYVEYAVTLKFDTYNGSADVLYYDWGAYIEELEMLLFMRDQPNTTVFTSLEIDGRMSRDNPDYAAAAVVFIDQFYMADIFAVWDAITGRVFSLDFGELKRYEDTFDEQADKHRGEVIRSIYASNGGWILDAQGDFLDLYGEVYDGYSSCSDYSWEYDAGY